MDAAFRYRYRWPQEKHTPDAYPQSLTILNLLEKQEWEDFFQVRTDKRWIHFPFNSVSRSSTLPVLAILEIFV